MIGYTWSCSYRKEDFQFVDAIIVEDLWKIYWVKEHRDGFVGGLIDLFRPVWKEKEAVRGIHFTIPQGQSVGYIGPNGSGKSTTIKMLTGILTPTSGKVRVNGIDPSRRRRENARQIGVVFGQRTQLWWDLAIKESFELFRHIYRIDEKTFRKNVEMMTELLDLDQFASIPVRQLSLGQRMRAEIACAFFHDPKIVYLDEPTIGLDVVAKERIRTFLKEINREKKTTIILTTHDMDDIEHVCERLILIDHGRIIYDGNLQRFVDNYGTDRILTVQFEEPQTSVELECGELIGFDQRQASIRFKKNEISATKLIQQLTARYPIRDCQIEEPKIEHLIRHVYESENVEDEGIHAHDHISI